MVIPRGVKGVDINELGWPMDAAIRSGVAPVSTRPWGSLKKAKEFENETMSG